MTLHVPTRTDEEKKKQKRKENFLLSGEGALSLEEKCGQDKNKNTSEIQNIPRGSYSTKAAEGSVFQFKYVSDLSEAVDRSSLNVL